MNYTVLKSSLSHIQLKEDEKEFLKNEILNKIQKRKKYSISYKIKLAFAVCIILSIPILSNASDSIYNLIYTFTPNIAQFFQIVKESDTDNGIKLDVEAISIIGNKAGIYISLEDLTENRIDSTTDLFDSYYINAPFDSSSTCKTVSYSKNKITYLIEITRTDNKPIQNKKITFGVKEFISGKKEYLNTNIPLDIKNYDTKLINITGYGGKNPEISDTLSVLSTKESILINNLENIYLTGIGYINDKLHVQIYYENNLQNDNHGFLYFINKSNNQKIDSEIFYFNENDKKYAEYIFDITNNTLDDYSLFGDFYTSGNHTTGNWKITFPIK